jgi:putative hydrolase of the HAD superfamily
VPDWSVTCAIVPISLLAFDADDTLWHNENYFRFTETRFCELLEPFAEPDHLSDRLLATERRNVELYGYGAKGFMLSLIETALEVTDHRVPGETLFEILRLGKEILAQPVELLDGVVETVTALAGSHRLIVITKGDLIHQESKAARSGLAELFERVEVVAEKDDSTYRRIFDRCGVAANEICMVGNSVKSDVLPALALGCYAVHVPYTITWAMEVAERPVNESRFAAIDTLRELPEVLTRWA